jgi:protein TonB
MFERALLESATHGIDVRRTYSTAASFGLQAAALAAFIIVPIITSQIAPQLQHQVPIVVPRLETSAPPIESSGMNVGNSPFSTATTLHQPRSINRLDHSNPAVETPPVSIHPIESGNGHSSLSSLFTSSGPRVVLGAEPAKRLPVSVLEAGVVLARVQPLYPHLAMETGIQGTVHLHAVITPRGTLEELNVLSGHPMLARAATDAVRQWRFRPYVLNGNPIEVQTEIMVNFSLN